MVRFSDMLGGNDDSEAARPTTLPPEEIADEIPEVDEEPDEEPAAELPTPDEPEPPPNASPQEVLDRLTQYAAEHVPPASAGGKLEPVGDDLLPNAKRGRRS
jgi:hypothetical protein